MIKQEVTWYLSHVPGVQVLSLDLPLWPHRTALMAASVTSPMCLLGREVSGHLQICVTVSWVSCFSLGFVSSNKICASLLLAGCG